MLATALVSNMVPTVLACGAAAFLMAAGIQSLARHVRSTIARRAQRRKAAPLPPPVRGPFEPLPKPARSADSMALLGTETLNALESGVCAHCGSPRDVTRPYIPPVEDDLDPLRVRPYIQRKGE